MSLPGATVIAGSPGARAVRAPDERTLVRAMAQGDRGAAEELVERTYGLVYASLVRLCRDADLAADLTQETYRKAWAALASFDARASFSTWLYRIAYNTFLNHLRRPLRVVSLEDASSSAADPAPDAEEAMMGRADADRLRRAVLELPEDLRFTVSARFWGDVPVKEIALLEEITPMGVRKRLRRAFRQLAATLAKEGGQ